MNAPTGPEAYRRSADLLDQAFDVRPPSRAERAVGTASPQFVLDDRERNRYIAAAQVYALLALAAATAEQMGSRGPGDITREWSELVWPQPPENTGADS